MSSQALRKSTRQRSFPAYLSISPIYRVPFLPGYRVLSGKEAHLNVPQHFGLLSNMTYSHGTNLGESVEKPWQSRIGSR